jgi:acetolactate synthase-1/2/3 large subunit
MSSLSVAQLIVRFLERLNVSHVFGMPGAHILPIYDALQDSSLRSILVKHEQGAAFMACGLARARALEPQRPKMGAGSGFGVCLATAGPGALNLVTGIANAYADRLPLLAITGETPTASFGRGGLQESSGEGQSVNQSLVFGGITRYHKILERTDYIPSALRHTAQILRAQHSGPVVLSLPYNVQNETLDAQCLDQTVIDTQPPIRAYSRSQIEALAQRVRDAAHPVLIAGYGCLRAHVRCALHTLGERHRCQIATTLKGKGAIDEDNPYALGCLGVTSDGAARAAITEKADVVVILGATLNERTTYQWNTPLFQGKYLIQVDADPDQLQRTYHADLALQGDIAHVLSDLCAALDQAGARSSAAMPSFVRQRPSPPPHFAVIAHFFQCLERICPQGLHIFDDNMILAQSYLRLPPIHYYHPNSGISALGHALPAAIGAHIATGLPTLAILGDGGFQMCAMEWMSAINQGATINVLLINNGTLGLIRKTQHHQYGQRYIDSDFTNPDYALLAQSFGVRHWRIENRDDVDTLFRQANWVQDHNLIELMWDRDVFPSYNSGR